LSILSINTNDYSNPEVPALWMAQRTFVLKLYLMAFQRQMNLMPTQDIPSVCESTAEYCLVPFRNLLYRLNDSTFSPKVPPVTCVVSDGGMSFTLDATEEFGIPNLLFHTHSACGFLG
jgi:hypothetical protein